VMPRGVEPRPDRDRDDEPGDEGKGETCDQNCLKGQKRTILAKLLNPLLVPAVPLESPGTLSHTPDVFIYTGRRGQSPGLHRSVS